MCCSCCWCAGVRTPARRRSAATLSGYVQDQAGGAMPGATVTADWRASNWSARPPPMPPASSTCRHCPRGTYQVKVEMSGFETQVQKERRGHGGRQRAPGFRARASAASPKRSIVSGRTDDGGDAKRHAVEPDRRPARAGPADERPQRRRARRHLRGRHRQSARTRTRPTAARGRSCRSTAATRTTTCSR